MSLRFKPVAFVSFISVAVNLFSDDFSGAIVEAVNYPLKSLSEPIPEMIWQVL
jgi:hypothetical protein